MNWNLQQKSFHMNKKILESVQQSRRTSKKRVRVPNQSRSQPVQSASLAQAIPRSQILLSWTNSRTCFCSFSATAEPILKKLVHLKGFLLEIPILWKENKKYYFLILLGSVEMSRNAPGPFLDISGQIPG